MLTLLAAAAAVKLAYSFPAGTSRTYDVAVIFDGYVPLFGGNQGKVEADLVVTAKGLAAAADGSPQVLSSLDDIHVLLDGNPLNVVTKESAVAFFPPTTISMTPLGETLKTNAPDSTLPVKLPGLDIKRFPDITYIPLQLPPDGAEVGKPYTFKRKFGDSDIDYTVTPTKVGDAGVDMDVALKQSYTVFETDGKDVTTERKDAASEVKTDWAGKGTATFDPNLGAFTAVRVDANAHSIVTDLTTKQQSTRDLKTTLTIKLRKD
ncbi:MAG TPA: hypothetical protein VMI31_11095 [Fimbriimonadaceae bacterium]|nr:hypothetical protein [Fimbriimonadaceae bacterium]